MEKRLFRSPAWSWLLLAAVVGSPSAQAEQTLYGFTGLLQIPTAEVVQHGYLDIFLNEDLLNQSRDAPEKPPSVDHENFSLLIGVIPGLEFGANLAGGTDANGDLTAGDLSGNIKYAHKLSSRWALAGGITDFYGSNEKQKLSRAAYLVSTYKTPKVIGSFGYAKGRNFLDGPFLGVEVPLGPYVSLLADYGGQSAQAGIRAHLTKESIGSLYGVYKAAATKFNNTTIGGGGTINLETNHWFSEKPLFSHYISGLQATKVSDTGDQAVIQTDSIGYRWAESDAIPEICARYAGGKSTVVRRATRYGIPVYEANVDCVSGQQSDLRWSASSLSDFKSLSKGWSSSPIYLEARFGLEDRSVIGTETGNYEYSDALLSTLRLQTPIGLAAYVTHELPVATSKDFEPDGIFAFQRHDDGLRETAVQLAVHPLPGLFAVGTAGRTRVNAFVYNFDHLDVAALFWGGRLQLKGTYANYQAVGLPNIKLPPNKMRIANAEVMVPEISAAFELSYGEFFYRDRGFRFTASRYLGPSIVSMFYRHAEKGQPNQLIGLALAVPFSTRNGLRFGPVSVGGSPYFRYNKGTTLNTQIEGNVLRPLLLGEPRPIYNLDDDWLLNSRLYPSNQ